MKNIISHTEFQRNNKKFQELIDKGDVIVVKNNKPSFVAVKASNYEDYKKSMKVIKKYRTYKLGEIIKILRDNSEHLKKGGVESISIFGSFSRGEEKVGSDLDLVFNTKVEGIKSFLVDDQIQKLLPNIKVHALNNLYVKDSLKKVIEKDLINVF